MSAPAPLLRSFARIARRFARPRAIGALLPLAALSGCSTIVMHPFGDVAIQQAHLVAIATWLMLIIIVPVIILTVLFAWRYRQSNTEAEYAPDWHHSTRLELVIWGAPLLIIIALGAVTWISTHKLDPYRPLDRIDAEHPVTLDTPKPLVVDVVSLDWKWLFIYPEEGVATVNELAAPVNRPIEFHLTSSSVMNVFYVPALAGQIYTMPAMTTQLHAVINKAGVYEGFSANYSGAGFSDMHFKFIGLSDPDFAKWIATNKASGNTLTRDVYRQLEEPSKAVPVERFARVETGLFDAIVDRCAGGGTMCNSQMMAIDAAGGMGKGGIANVSTQPWRGLSKPVVSPLCVPNTKTEVAQKPAPLKSARAKASPSTAPPPPRQASAAAPSFMAQALAANTTPPAFH